MGDVQIPGAPFVVTIPDEWFVIEMGTEETGPQAILAYSNSGTVAKYYILNAQTIAEATAWTTQCMNNLPGTVVLSMDLNGMAFVICSGVRVYNYDEYWEIFYQQTLGPFSGAPRGHPSVVELSFTFIFTENEGVILRTDIYTHPETPDYTNNTSIILLSGIWPAPPTISRGKLPLPPIKGSHPIELPNNLIKAKALEKITHAKIEKQVSISRTERYGYIPENNRKLLEYLKILQELYKFLKKDTKYADYVEKLAEIIKGLESLTK